MPIESQPPLRPDQRLEIIEVRLREIDNEERGLVDRVE
jgi:hypothetical protein